MARGKITPSPIRKLVVRLRDDESWTFEQIGAHLKMARRSIQRVYNAEKHPTIKKQPGRKRKTTKR